MREPGATFLEMARRAISVLWKVDPELESFEIDKQRELGAFICDALADPSELDREFPRAIPNFLYGFFATTTSEKAHAVLVIEGMDDEEEAIFIKQAYREAALGMMDNPNCVYQ